jgi:hypothetical protein
MNKTPATYVATCHAFIATPGILEKRALAPSLKRSRDPGDLRALEALVEEVCTAIAGSEPTGSVGLAASVGCADRLAITHPSALAELVGVAGAACQPGGGRLEFVTLTGPRSYWPEREARSYRASLAALTLGDEGVDRAGRAARDLLKTARWREAGWRRDEWRYRLAAAVTGWIYWDDEPGAARDV